MVGTKPKFKLLSHIKALPSVNAIALTSKGDYCLATSSGLHFLQYHMHESEPLIVTQSLNTLGALDRVVEVRPYVFVASNFDSGKVTVYDRKKQSTSEVRVTKKGGVSDIVVLGNLGKLPFLVLKTANKVHALNTINWQSYDLTKIYDTMLYQSGQRAWSERDPLSGDYWVKMTVWHDSETRILRLTLAKQLIRKLENMEHI